MKFTKVLFRLGFLIFISPLAQSEPPSSSRWIGVEAFTDNFESHEVDSSKWYPLNPKWTGRPPSRFAKENVYLRNGKLVIKGSKVSPDEAWAKEGIEFKTGVLKSQRPIKYGYFEIQARVAKSKISSAFWLYDHSKTTWTEIDIFELCGVPPCATIYHTNAHARIRNSLTGNLDELTFTENFPAAELINDGLVIAALEWDENFLRWYVNGKIIRELKNEHWHEPLFLVIDSEVFLDWFGRPADNELPSEFLIDYVRVWQRTH